jgi:TM2 domain-containing membrane protein YozV
MEKRLCLTSFWFGLPVCGMGAFCLLDGFAPFGFLSRFQIIACLIYSLSTGDDRSTI